MAYVGEGWNFRNMDVAPREPLADEILLPSIHESSDQDGGDFLDAPDLCDDGIIDY